MVSIPPKMGKLWGWFSALLTLQYLIFSLVILILGIGELYIRASPVLADYRKTSGSGS